MIRGECWKLANFWFVWLCKYNICLEPHGDYSNKINYPIYTKTCLRYKGFNVLFFLELLPAFIRRRLGLVNQSEIDIVLDASGFAYGDDWSHEIAKNRILKEKTPVIFLPQSFGEFNLKKSKGIIKEIVKKGLLIYAREEKGREEIKKTTNKDVRVVRDITFGCIVEKSGIDRDLIIIPNFQVYEREGESYINKILMIIECNANRRITLLNHEGAKDEKIIEKICNLSRFSLEVINGKNGREIKSIIGSSKMVVTSRYHGLVSALSQKVPVIALGWSFKYREIMKYFSIQYTEDVKKINDLIVCKEYSDYFAGQAYRDKLKEINDDLELMWHEVELVISEG